jgi:ribosome-associated protein
MDADGLIVHGRLIAHADALRASYSSSSGPGGQNVNKRATKCQLRIALVDLALTPAQLARLETLASMYTTTMGELLITSDEHKSQERNRDECIHRLRTLVQRAMIAPKIRKKTKPTRGSKERRITEKKRRGDVKRLRSGGE